MEQFFYLICQVLYTAKLRFNDFIHDLLMAFTEYVMIFFKAKCHLNFIGNISY